jgi:hypothetical protein
LSQAGSSSKAAGKAPAPSSVHAVAVPVPAPAAVSWISISSHGSEHLSMDLIAVATRAQARAGSRSAGSRRSRHDIPEAEVEVISEADTDDETLDAGSAPARKKHDKTTDHSWSVVVHEGRRMVNLSSEEAVKFLEQEAEKQHPGLGFRPEAAKVRVGGDAVRKYRCRYPLQPILTQLSESPSWISHHPVDLEVAGWIHTY